jgi:hypothetical protein
MSDNILSIKLWFLPKNIKVTKSDAKEKFL